MTNGSFFFFLHSILFDGVSFRLVLFFWLSFLWWCIFSSPHCLHLTSKWQRILWANCFHFAWWLCEIHKKQCYLFLGVERGWGVSRIPSLLVEWKSESGLKKTTTICVRMCIRPGNKENLNRFMLFKIIHMHAGMKIIKPQKGSVGYRR